MENNSYDTLSQATKGLKERGFTLDFEVKDENTLKSDKGEVRKKELEVVEFHRFEGMTNPSDMSAIYALESNDGKKGILIDAYGVDANDKIAAFLKNLDIERK
jgi:hypothetical protein